jgi:hypothetical protein
MKRWILSFLTGLTLLAQAPVPPQSKSVPSWAPPGWPKEAIIWGLSDRIKEQLIVQVPHLIHWQYQWNKDSLGLCRDPIQAWKQYKTFPKNKLIRIDVATDERKLYAYSVDLGIGMGFTKYTHGLGKAEVWFIDPKDILKDMESLHKQALRSYKMRELADQPHLPNSEIQKLVSFNFWVPIGEYQDGRASMGSNLIQRRMLKMILCNKDIPLAEGKYIELIIPAFKDFDDSINVWAKYQGESRPARFIFSRNWDDDPDHLVLSNDLRGFYDEQEKSNIWKEILKHAYKHLLITSGGRIFDLPTDGVEVKPVTWPTEDPKLIEAWIKKPGVREITRKELQATSD